MIKGELSQGYIPINKFSMVVEGIASMTVIEVSGIEQELETVDLPDKTVATSGRAGTTEFSIKVPAHEDVTMAALDTWWKSCQGDVAMDYKKKATLSLLDTFGLPKANWSISGMFPTKRALPELNAGSEGEMAMAEWTFKADDVVKV